MIRGSDYIFPKRRYRILADDEVYALVSREGEEALRSALGTSL